MHVYYKKTAQPFVFSHIYSFHYYRLDSCMYRNNFLLLHPFKEIPQCRQSAIKILNNEKQKCRKEENKRVAMIRLEGRTA